MRTRRIREGSGGWTVPNGGSHTGEELCGDGCRGGSWGELLEDILIERLVKRQNEKLVGKLNKSIEKERDDLKLSLSEWFENWGRGSQPADTSTSSPPVTTQTPAN